MKYKEKHKVDLMSGKIGMNSRTNEYVEKYGFDIDPDEMPFSDKMESLIPIGYKPPYIQTEKYLILASSMNFD